MSSNPPKPEMSLALEAASNGDENLHHFVVEQFFEMIDDVGKEVARREEFLQLPIPLRDELAYDHATVLQKLGAFDQAAAAMKKVADRGFWPAQFRLGHWLLRNHNFKDLDIDGYEYLRRSSGPGHREGMFAYHLYKRVKSPLYMKPYHFLAAICYLPFVVNRMGQLGQ